MLSLYCLNFKWKKISNKWVMWEHFEIDVIERKEIIGREKTRNREKGIKEAISTEKRKKRSHPDPWPDSGHCW